MLVKYVLSLCVCVCVSVCMSHAGVMSKWLNLGSCKQCFRVKASYLSKVAYFNLPHLHLAPLLRWLQSNFAETFRSENWSWAIVWCCALFCVSHFDTIPACDGQTHNLTYRKSIRHNRRHQSYSWQVTVSHLAFPSWLKSRHQSYFWPVSHVCLCDWLRV